MSLTYLKFLQLNLLLSDINKHRRLDRETATNALLQSISLNFLEAVFYQSVSTLQCTSDFSQQAELSQLLYNEDRFDKCFVGAKQMGNNVDLGTNVLDFQQE